MKKTKLSAFVMGALMTASLASCSGGNKVKIGIGLYTMQGDMPEATKAFVSGIANELGIEPYYFELSTYSAEQNVQNVKNVISWGAKGIILSADSGIDSILEECEQAGNVKVGGYIADFNTTFDGIKTDENFVGTSCDGRYEGYAWGSEVAARMIAAGHKNIGIVRFPGYAYPHQDDMESAFRTSIASYNATAEEADKITLPETSTVLNFDALPLSYFSDEGKDVDAIYAICATANVYRTTITAGKRRDIKIYGAGFDSDETNKANDFTQTETADGCIQEMIYAPVETIIYPLVKVLNAINDQKYTDEPETALRVETGQVDVTSRTIYDKVLTKQIYATHDIKNSFITASEVKNLLAANGGTQAKLVKAIKDMNTETLMAL